MDTLARSPALNPASMPFFPGGMRGGESERSSPGLGLQRQSPQYSISTSSLSASPSDYRSVGLTPSPPRDDRDRVLDHGAQFHAPSEGSRFSPAMSQGDSANGSIYTPHSSQGTRDASVSDDTESLPHGEDTPGPGHSNGQIISNTSLYNHFMRGFDAAPTMLDTASVRSSVLRPSFISSSPASSLDSGSQLASSTDLSTSLEVQLKSSPFIHDILDRLSRCEYTTREVQRDLGDVHRKLDILLDRALGNFSAPPEFKDPFAPSHGSSTPSLNGPRTSMGNNIAPNQSAPSDDITSISTRLNTLTTSVGQLLALQTQQLQTQQLQATNTGLQNTQVLGANLQQGDLNANQTLPQSMMSSPSVLGHGFPNRPDIRQSVRVPNNPMRTWSAGALDLPLRASEPSVGPLARQDAMFRDKRRSVTNFMRRESVGGESLNGGNSNREGGPVITKWEQLSIAPELLRSLNTFGVGPPNKIQQRALPFLLRGSDIIAQAPPTQERIAAYVIPAIHIALVNSSRAPLRGPLVVMISTTVDQATQAQRMIRDLGGPIGVKSALGVGAASVNSDLGQELRLLQQNVPHVICGTPQKLHALFTSPGGISGADVRFLVLDEVDQLIARNLHDFVFNIIKLLPPPRSRPIGPNGTTINPPTSSSPSSFTNFDSGSTSSLAVPFQAPVRRFSGVSSSPPTELANGTQSQIERQTALFSNTVPQDVLNLASAIQLREPVRVLVRRDGNVTHADTSQGARGLRQFYLYLAFTAGGRSDAPLPAGGLGIIGSGRGSSSAETAQAREWKLDALADLFEDLDVPQAVIHVGGMMALDSVVYKLASRGLEAVPLHGDMNAGTKLAALNKFRSTTPGLMRQAVAKVLVVYDVQVKTPEVSQVPLIINYDLPKAVEEYAHRVAPAIAPSYSRAGVVVNFVTATGGDVEMLRSIECFYKIKCPEVPMSLRDIV